jgi:ABC-type nitrate/sulfonate/bicarbonate transport system substrate-binding protein
MHYIKGRVKLKVGDKIVDLKESDNPHKDLSKAVIKALQEGGHLADEPQAPVATSKGGGAELAAAQAEIARLTEENEQLKGANEALKAELADLKPTE